MYREVPTVRARGTVTPEDFGFFVVNVFEWKIPPPKYQNALLPTNLHMEKSLPEEKYLNWTLFNMEVLHILEILYDKCLNL